MKTFKDSKDATWEIAVNCDTVEAIKEACGVNVLDLLDPESGLSQEVRLFPPLLAKLLFAALANQAKVKEVDDREFRRRMNGDALAEASDALLEEIISFSPRHRRQVAAAVLEKNREVEHAATALALTRLADPELQTRVMAALENKLREEMAAALERLNPEIRSQRSEVAKDLASTFSPAVGTPPDCSASPAPDRTPGVS